MNKTLAVVYDADDLATMQVGCDSDFITTDTGATVEVRGPEGQPDGIVTLTIDAQVVGPDDIKQIIKFLKKVRKGGLCAPV